MSEPQAKKRKTPSNASKSGGGGGGGGDSKNKPNKDKAPRKTMPAVEKKQKDWTEGVDAMADQAAKEYRAKLGEWVIAGKDKDRFPEYDVACDLFKAFKPPTKFNVDTARKFVQAVREWQYFANSMRDKHNLPLDARAEGLDPETYGDYGADQVADGLDELIDKWSGTSKTTAAAAAAASK